jgi:hypothetical protein
MEILYTVVMSLFTVVMILFTVVIILYTVVMILPHNCSSKFCHPPPRDFFVRVKMTLTVGVTWSSR